MNANFVLLLVAFIGVLLLVTKPLGIYIADVMEGRPNFAVRAGARLEKLLYKLCAIDPREEMSWREYATALLLFNVLGAGDGFMSGLLKGWLDGEDWPTSLKYANACGAFAVSRHGCTPAYPSWEELQFFLARGRTGHIQTSPVVSACREFYAPPLLHLEGGESACLGSLCGCREALARWLPSPLSGFRDESRSCTPRRE